MLLIGYNMGFRSNDTAAYHPAREEADRAFAEHVYLMLENEAPRTTEDEEMFLHRYRTQRSIFDYLTWLGEEMKVLRPGREDIGISQSMSHGKALETLEQELEGFDETDPPYGDLRRAHEHLSEYVEEANMSRRFT